MSPSPRLFRGLSAIVVGAVAALVLATVVSGPRASSASAERQDEDLTGARTEFLHRWEAWRRSTLRFSETSVRRSGGQDLASTVEIAQRFPDRIVRDGTQVSARLGDRRIGCSADPAGPPECVDNGSYQPERELQLELDEFRTLTSGSTATYRLTRLAGGCFRLRHVVDEFRPRWGDRFDVCFGEGTGAVTREQTVNGSVTTTIERRGINAAVTDADFALPATPTAAAASLAEG